MLDQEAQEPSIVFLRGNGMMEHIELVVGFGDHTCQVFKLTKEHVRGLCVDSTRAYTEWGDWK